MLRAFVERYSDMAVERIDAEEVSYERMQEAVASMPFLVERKLVVLRQPSRNKEFVEGFGAWITMVPDETDVLIIEPKLDRRGVYFKQLKKYTDFKDFPALDANSLVRYAVGYASKQKARLSTANARLLVERIGPNQLQIEHELDKLASYNATITPEAIERLTEASPQSSIFDLIQATFAGNGKHALILYEEQRTMGVEPQQIIAMLAWQLHLLALAKVGAGKSADTIAGDAKLNPFTVKKSQSLANSISLRDLRTSLRELRELDTRLKRESMSPDEAVKYFIVSHTT
jgi:DNA polymerase III subunit delta